MKGGDGHNLTLGISQMLQKHLNHAHKSSLIHNIFFLSWHVTSTFIIILIKSLTTLTFSIHSKDQNDKEKRSKTKFGTFETLIIILTQRL